MRILVVDDGSEPVETLRALLSREGYQVERVANGPAALARLAAPNPPALVVAEPSTLMASLAHEINNPLTYVAGNLALLDDELQSQGYDGAVRDLVRGALDGAQRMVRLMASLQPPAVAAPQPEPASRGRVLVVDDEAQIGTLMLRALGREHEVTVLTQASDALERAAAGERWSVILCDLMMPDMSGMELHARLSAQAPELAERMVFLSGGAFTPSAQAFLERVENARLEKPIDLPRLRTLVREAVRRNAG